MPTTTTAFAPASIGNVAVGFDMLGLALDGVGDRVVATRTAAPGVTVAEVRGLDGELHPYLSTDADKNTASIAAQAFWAAHGDAGGVELKVLKGVPLQSGMGSSAASAVAAVVAVNGLLDSPLPADALLMPALEGEQYASGGLHADNIAPSLLGGLVFCPQVLLPDVLRVDPPEGVSAVLIHPDLQVNTAQARRGLSKSVGMQKWIDQQGFLGGFLLACANSDIPMLRRTLRDIVIEPQRSAAVPCFDAVREAAERADVLGFSLSGSGPSLFALTESGKAVNTATAMEQACRSQGIDCQSYIAPMNALGAHIEHAE